MLVTYRQLEPGFSTADAARPILEYRDGVLVLRFVDWRDRPIVVRFPETVAFRWQDDDACPAGARDDEAYEVIQSPWLAELREIGSIGSKHHHFMLCFNAHGVLNVVALTLVMHA
jgi:hypothetical protein